MTTPAAVRSTAADGPPTALRRAHEKRTEAGAAAGPSGLWWLLAVLAVATCITLHIVISSSAVAPRTPWDEIHPLEIARMLSGESDVPKLSGSGYYPGWAILMTPIWWFTHDPATVYRIAVILGNVLGVATIIPLAMVGRYLRMTAPQAIAAAGLAMCMPGRIEPADYAMSEQLLTFCCAWAVLGMFALWKRPSWWRLAAFVAAIAAAYLTHTRALALLLTAVVWLLLYTRRSVTKALVGVLLLIATWWGVDSVAAAINHRMLLSGSSKTDLAVQAITQAEPGPLGQLLASQSWAQFVGTAGLFALGAVVIVIWTLRELRTLRLGPGAFLLGLTLSAIAMSVVWWYQPEALWGSSFHGLEAWLYSRYIDQVAPLVVLVAVAALLRRVSAGIIAVALGVLAVSAAAVVLWVAPHVPLWYGLSSNTAAVNSWQGMFPEHEFHRPLMPTLGNANRFWLWASLVTAVALLAMLVLRRFPRSAVAILLIAAATLSATANLDQKRLAPRMVGASLEAVDRAAGSDRPQRADLDMACRTKGLATAEMINWAGFWFSSRDVELVDTRTGESFDSELVISCADGSTMKDLDARRVKGGSSYGFGLWVRPGPLQDQLARDGLLVK